MCSGLTYKMLQAMILMQRELQKCEMGELIEEGFNRDEGGGGLGRRERRQTLPSVVF